MHELVQIIFVTVVVIVLILLSLPLVYSFKRLFTHNLDAPYVPLSRRGRKVISQYLRDKIQEGQIVVDLGSGDGALLGSLYRQEPQAKYVGVEISCFPWLLSRVFHVRQVGAHLQFHRGNLFDQDISQADFIVCYLLGTMLSAVYEKFQVEAKPGARLITIGFAVPDIPPDEVIKIPSQKIFSLDVSLYVYKR
jgi:ribosomal protein L11 methylase PrmA